MSFTSPIFLFAFLPIALLIYSVTPDNIKKYSFILISIGFFFFANIKEPIYVLLVLAIIAITYCGGKIIRISASKKTAAIFCIAEIAFLILYKGLYFYYDFFDTYPMGMSLYVMASVSYLCDTGRKDADINASVADVALYVSFFPTVMAGPLVKYKEFVHVFESRTYSVKNFSRGAILFSCGFIKKIIIAETLKSVVADISFSGTVTENLFVALIDLILFFAVAIFEIWGYSDMGCGIACMFGYKLNKNFGSFADFYSVTTFFDNFFVSLKKWISDYLYHPLSGKKKEKISFVPFLASCVIFSVFIKPTVFAAVSGTLVAVVIYAESKFSIAEKAKKRKITKALFRIASIVLLCLVFSFVRVESVTSLLDELGKINVNMLDFNTFVKHFEMIFLKIVFVVFIMLVLIFKRKLESKRNKSENVWKTLGDVLVLVLFVFSIIYFMPQYPECAKTAFDFIIL